MAKFFDSFQLNGLVLRNRSIMASAYNLNVPKEEFATLAREQVGLIFSGGLRKEHIPSFKDRVEACHQNNGKIALQLVSSLGGRFTDSDPIAVSELEENHPFFNHLVPYSPHHEATEDEIFKIIASYADGAAIAKEIGADAVEIHSAHSSLLAQFLSPITNRRKDRWGGTISSRTRIHKEIAMAIREKVGREFPLIIKVGIKDEIDGGIQEDEGIEIAALISSFGYDAIEISCGLQDFRKTLSNDWSKTAIKSRMPEPYYREATRKIKKRVAIPVIVSGGVRSYKAVEEILQNDEADLIAMCRPFIREHTLLSRWKGGDTTSSKCISCNGCLKNPAFRCVFTS
jgi:2,4-dienoyl-CoA reductase-like NADH-dependent reductase (Old Yellow Enzyme family)